ncbi:hypothetical protein Q7P35_010632 [Cladosporium inversicolor]
MILSGTLGPTPPPPLALVSSQILSLLHQHPPPNSTHHTQTRRRISLTPSAISPATSKRRRTLHPSLRDPPPPHSANCLQRRSNTTTRHPSHSYSVPRGRPLPTHALKEAVHSPEFMYSSHAHAFALDPPPEQPQPFRITRRSRLSSHNSTNG